MFRRETRIIGYNTFVKEKRKDERRMRWEIQNCWWRKKDCKLLQQKQLCKKGYSRIFFESCSCYFNTASSILELELPFSSGWKNGNSPKWEKFKISSCCARKEMNVSLSPSSHFRKKRKAEYYPHLAMQWMYKSSSLINSYCICISLITIRRREKDSKFPYYYSICEVQNSLKSL